MHSHTGASRRKECRGDVYEGERCDRGGPERRPELAADDPAEREAREQRELEVAHRPRAKSVVASRRIREVREQRGNPRGGREPLEGTAHDKDASFVRDAEEERGERGEQCTACHQRLRGHCVRQHAQWDGTQQLGAKRHRGQGPHQRRPHVEPAARQVRDVDADQHTARSTGHAQQPIAGDDERQPTRCPRVRRARLAARVRWR
jgi:hypothetical protein